MQEFTPQVREFTPQVRELAPKVREFTQQVREFRDITQQVCVISPKQDTQLKNIVENDKTSTNISIKTLLQVWSYNLAHVSDLACTNSILVVLADIEMKTLLHYFSDERQKMLDERNVERIATET